MAHAFARVSAVVAMLVEDYFANGKRWWVRLHEKGGKRHEAPAHHKLEAFLDEYLKAAGIVEGGKSSLFRAATGRTSALGVRSMNRVDAYRMVSAGRRPSAFGSPSAVIPSARPASRRTWRLAARWRTLRRWRPMRARAPPSSTIVLETRSRGRKWSGSGFESRRATVSKRYRAKRWLVVPMDSQIPRQIILQSHTRQRSRIALPGPRRSCTRWLNNILRNCKQCGEAVHRRDSGRSARRAVRIAGGPSTGMPVHRSDEKHGRSPEQIAFGENLRARRMQLGLTQAQLAELTGTRQHYISEIETGQVNLTLETMTTLCRALGSDVRTFLKPRNARRTD